MYMRISRPSSLPAAHKRRKAPGLVLLLLSVIATVILTACGGSSGTTSNPVATETLTFGAPVSLTGSTATEGKLTLEGYQLWEKYVNNNGGIKVGDKSYKVKVKYYDDGSQPTKSAQLTQQLISTDKVNFLLGPYGTSATLQDEAIALQYRIPMVEANGAAKSIFEKKNPYIFGVLSPASEYAKVMLQAALTLSDPPKNVAIISADDSFSLEVAVAARDYAKSKNLPVVYYQQYPNASTDLTNVLTALKSTGANGGVPDMILASGHVAEDITIIKASKQLNINPKLFAFTVGPATPEFATSLSKDANYVLSSSQWTTEVKYNGIDVFKTASNYAQLYRQEYGHDPSYQSAESTAAGLAFQYAIQQAGSIEPQKVRDALAKLDIMTFYGQIKFDETGANTFKPMVTVQIQEGKIVTVYPADVANGKIQYPTPPFSQRQ